MKKQDFYTKYQLEPKLLEDANIILVKEDALKFFQLAYKPLEVIKASKDEFQALCLLECALNKKIPYFKQNREKIEKQLGLYSFNEDDKDYKEEYSKALVEFGGNVREEESFITYNFVIMANSIIEFNSLQTKELQLLRLVDDLIEKVSNI